MLFSLFDIQFWFFLLAFIPALIISIYVPGSFIVKKLRIGNPMLDFVLTNSLGIALWAVQGYIFGYLQLRFLTYAYLFASVVIFIIHLKYYKTRFIKMTTFFSRKNFVIFLLIIFGSIFQLMTVIFSGIRYIEGVKLFGNSSVDGIMHLSYIQSIANKFPPEEPGMVGILLRNYHYWSDLVLAEFNRIWHIPVSHLFFQFFPIYLSLLIGITAFTLVKEWGGTRKMALWFVFLLYFASDAAYLVLIILGKPWGFYTPAIDSGVLQFLNMPHVFGKLIFLTGLITFHKWVVDKNKLFGFVTVILFASLFGFKVYFGIFAALGLVCYFGYSTLVGLIKGLKKGINTINLLLFFLFILLSSAIFLPHNYGAGGFVYVYLEWPRSLLGQGSIDWRDWWLRRQVYEAAGNLRNLVILDIVAVVIAFVSIYGTRLAGFFITPNLFKFLRMEKVLFLVPALFIFHLLGLFTIQKSGGVNVFNFFSVSSVILSLFSAYLISRIKFRRLGIFIILIFVLLTVPRTVNEIYGNFNRLGSSDYRLISNNELEAFSFIKANTEDAAIVQAHPHNSLDRETPYTAFFSKRGTYLGGGNLLATHNVRIDDRRDFLDEVFKSTEIVDFTTKLKQKNISYIYLLKNPEQELNFVIDSTYTEKFFENEEVLILKLP